MFDNISEKIKSLASTVAWIGIICCILIGIILFAIGLSIYNGMVMVIVGFLIAILGSLLSWFSSWVLYGFGVLIEKTTTIADNISYITINKDSATSQKLKTINEWLSEGLITEEEFKAKKQKIERDI